MNVEEARMKRKDWMAKRAEQGFAPPPLTASHSRAEKTGMETRVCIPGHMQRRQPQRLRLRCWLPSSAAMLPSWWRSSATAYRGHGERPRDPELSG